MLRPNRVRFPQNRIQQPAPPAPQPPSQSPIVALLNFAGPIVLTALITAGVNEVIGANR